MQKAASVPAEKELDPYRIGIMERSAGGHLSLMGVTSSRHQSYAAIDDIDHLSCKVQWIIGICPAYALSDGESGTNTIVPELSSIDVLVALTCLREANKSSPTVTGLDSSSDN